uniref:Protein E6 n=1 Tax=Human papillomavirus TaxID=10566 RepID=A0A385PIV7_9PAPI|nr:MAG: E6 protein [Human papillomavirus]
METSAFPTSLDAYCSNFAIPFFDLKLKCIFCKKYCSLKELASFFEKQLSLVWKGYICYACCESCLCLTAKYESENYFQCTCKVQDLHGLLEKPLGEILIRCFYCYDLLDLATKYDLIARDYVACLVRGHWRAPCRSCMKRQFWC